MRGLSPKSCLPAEKKRIFSVGNLTTLSLLLAIMLVLQWFERLLPPPLFIPAPVHYGLANIVVMFIVLNYSVGTALLFTLLKGVNALMFRGIIAASLSLGGSLLSVLIMLLLSRSYKKISLLLLSVAGAIAHNLGQLAVLGVFKFNIFRGGLLFLLPPLIFFGCLTGLLSGFSLRLVLPIWRRHLNRHRSTISLCLILCLMPNILVACNDTIIAKQQREYLKYFDTITTLVGKELTKPEFDKYAELLEQNLEHYHQLYNSFDTFEGVVNLATISQLPVDSKVEIDRDLYDLLVRSFDLQRGVEDKINILEGKLLQLWQSDLRQKQIPSQSDLAALDKVPTEAEALELEATAGHYWLRKKTDFTLELGAIAKGFAMSKIAENLSAAGAHNLLLSVGGDICPIGHGTVQWTAAIANPLLADKRGDIQKIVSRDSEQQKFSALKQQEWLDVIPLSRCLVTSGVYERYTVDEAGELYHHIIDPRTKRPEYRYLSISVAGDDIVTCDWLATLLFNCSLEEIQEYANQYGDYSFLVIDRQLDRYTYGSIFNQ